MHAIIVLTVMFIHLCRYHRAVLCIDFYIVLLAVGNRFHFVIGLAVFVLPFGLFSHSAGFCHCSADGLAQRNTGLL